MNCEDCHEYEYCKRAYLYLDIVSCDDFNCKECNNRKFGFVGESCSICGRSWDEEI